MYKLDVKNTFEHISKRKLRICTMGLGRVGLPLAASLSSRGFKVVGLDINSGKDTSRNWNRGYCIFGLPRSEYRDLQ